MLVAEDGLEELNYDLEEDGVVVRRSIETKVLRRGAWATVLFLYEELDRRTSRFRPAKVAVVRFQKLRGAYRKHASFPLASAEEASSLIEVLGRWLPSLSATDEGDAPPDLEPDLE